MPTPASVLVFSRDPQLLHTRSLILQNVGCTVYPASSLADVHRWLSEPHLDVLLLCHTLTAEDCDQAALLVHAKWPAVQVVSLFAGMSGCVSVADAAIDATDGPIKLIKTVQKYAHPTSPQAQKSPA